MNIERETFMAKLNGDLGKLFFHFTAVILTIKIWVLQFFVSVSERPGLNYVSRLEKTALVLMFQNFLSSLAANRS